LSLDDAVLQSPRMSQPETSPSGPLAPFAAVTVVRGAVVVKFAFKTMFDPMEIERLQGLMEELVRQTRAACYVLDMEVVEFVSSGFLGLLISASQTLKGMGSKTRLCRMAPGILRVIKTTHLDRVLDIRGTLDEAFADLTPA